ncbi:TonB-dependent receptor [Fulvivirga sp. M361]|uniref:SusC/RagA family TonB-linked outer membrane protein n=1 Tax=Fulvivirga sp. M361 TaxID=2594266 RepID=UPI00117BB60E|nr:TonB-dependent receptor [Fulvivirga sp. M361]TRX59602.1 TonB-dependent receptor [Fulvivirga sp. M361]
MNMFILRMLGSMFFLLCVQLANAQTFVISGTVYDETDVLTGAAVVQKGTSNGMITDINGKFSIEVPVGSTLEISYLGYVTQEYVIDSGQELTITLELDIDQLAEVVVIGYGAVKKSDLTGSVASIKSADIVNTAISSVDQGIQGKAAGVVVSMSSGQPGAPSSIRIRGTSSINGNNEPLYVIDGMFIEPEANIGAVTGPSLNPLESINPADIESIEILKDASATAIYGTRGANGVILITTKRGKAGKAVISFNYSTSTQELRKKIPLLNAAELAILGNEATDNAGAPRRTIYASPTNLGVGTDWQDEIFRVAAIHNFQASARGGNEKGTYSLSANYFDQEGIISNSGYSKGNVRVNLDQYLNSAVSIGTSININRGSLNGVVTDAEGAIPSSITSWALIFNPGLDVFDSNGEFVFENNTAQPSVGNPVADAARTQQVNTSTRLLGNVFLKWDILDNLSFKTSIGTDAVFVKEKSFVPNDIKRGQASNGQAAIAEQEGINWLLENTLSFNKKFGSHSIQAVIGHSMQQYDNDFLLTATSDFDDNRLGFNAIQVGADKTLIFNGTSGWQLQSFLGRVNYNLMEKYLFTVSARMDGSSKFGEGNKYGFFPSFAAAWRIKDEAFLENVSFLTDLKIRTGYGIVGNEGIPPYSSLGLLETTEAYFGENEIAKGAGPSTRQNDALQWETTSQLNIGIDAAFFDNRITLVADFYLKETKDLLLDAPVPYTSGFGSAFFNVGSLQNRGWELAVTSVNIDTEVEWNTTFNIAMNENKVLNLNSDEGIPADPLLGINGWTSIEQGVALGTFYGYETDGIIQSNEDPSQIPYFNDFTPTFGDRKYVDQNDDGVLDEKDRVVLGNANPDFSFGINNTVTFKGFSLGVFLQGVLGNEIVNFNTFGLESFDGNQNNSTAALNRWTPENPSNTYPRANVSPRVNTLSDHQVESGSYLRLKDITIGYDFVNLLKDTKFPVRTLKVFVSGKNLWTLTDYSGYDPEVNRFINNPRAFGADFGSYPTTKIITVGLNTIF